MNYLAEAIQKDYKPSEENRLSQVFSASFNNSEIFQKLFLKFIGYPFTKGLRSQPQRNFKVGGKDVRIDVCIVDVKDNIVIVIENKVEATVGLKRLKTYNRVKELAYTKKVALVKHYFEPLPKDLGWKVCYWTNLYEFYSDAFQKVEKKPVDRFIIQNFLNHLEELQMSRVRLIKGEDLKELAKAIYKIRNANSPYFYLNRPIFQIADNYVSMLEQIVNLARQKEIINRRIGRSFRFSPWIGNWWEDEDQKKENIFLGIELSLCKKFKQTWHIGTGLHLNGQAEYYAITTYTSSKDNTYLKEADYKLKDLIFDKYAHQVIQSWEKWLQ